MSSLFEDLPEDRGVRSDRSQGGEARVSRPMRDQVGWEMIDIDALLSADHPARLVAAFVASQDLSALYGAIRARSGRPGRDAIDPALLLSLWLYATIDGVGSAREVARLCTRDLPYRWLCGGVSVNYHALSDFRSNEVEYLDRLLTDSVTALVADGLVNLEQLGHDSVKVRANAGSGSFRREAKLATLRTQMEARVAALRSELDGTPGASLTRKQAARLRADNEKLERVKKAQSRLKELQAAQAKRPKKDRTDPKTGKDRDVRVSITDPDVRVLAMSAAERRPAWSFQVSSDPQTLVSVALSVHDGCDAGQIGPAIKQIQARYGQVPKVMIADCGYCDAKDISAVHEMKVAPIIPSNHERKKGDAAYQSSHCQHLPGVTEWRNRMLSEPARELYKLRCRIECVFAQLRNRGFRLLRLRGKEKARSEVLLHLIANNMLAHKRLRLAPALA